jgi:hypothetical protein
LGLKGATLDVFIQVNIPGKISRLLSRRHQDEFARRRVVYLVVPIQCCSFQTHYLGYIDSYEYVLETLPVATLAAELYPYRRPLPSVFPHCDSCHPAAGERDADAMANPYICLSGETDII